MKVLTYFDECDNIKVRNTKMTREIFTMKIIRLPAVGQVFLLVRYVSIK